MFEWSVSTRPGGENDDASAVEFALYARAARMLDDSLSLNPDLQSISPVGRSADKPLFLCACANGFCQTADRV